MNYIITKASTDDLRQLQQFFYDIVTNFESQKMINTDIQHYIKLVVDKSYWVDQFKNAFVYTAKLHGEIIGVSILSKDGVLSMLLVHHNYRKKGVGTNMFKNLENVASGNHIPALKIAIEEVTDTFFEKMGFEITTTIRKVAGNENFKDFVAVKYLKYYSKN